MCLAYFRRLCFYEQRTNERHTETVSVKDYDGKYIGGHKKNVIRSFKNIKAEAEKNTKNM